jgi:hypothetical protein
MTLDLAHRVPLVLLLAWAGCGGDEDVSQGNIPASDGSFDSSQLEDTAPNQDGDAPKPAVLDDASAQEIRTGDRGPPANEAGDATQDGSSCQKFAGDPLMTFNLTSGAFPGSGHPDVAVHVPAGFDPCRRPGVIIAFHGYDNCAVNLLGATDTACSSDGAVRAAMHLSDQIDAAGVNAMLIAPQLQFDLPSGDPGQLVNAGRLRDMLHELLVDHMSPLLHKPLDVPDIERTVVASFGGGYFAASAAIQIGGLAQLTEVDLYDSLFGNVSVFESWIHTNLSRFDPANTNSARFVDLYTTAGGTLVSSQAMASPVSAMLGDAGLTSSLLDSRTGTAPTAADLLHPLIFARVDGSADDLARTYFSALTRGAGFASLQ